MLKNVITYTNSNFPELRTSFSDKIEHDKYLQSLFIDEDCQYFWSNTNIIELNKKYKKSIQSCSSFELKYNNIDSLIKKHCNRFNGEPSIYFPDGIRVIEVRMPFALLNFNNWTSTIKKIGNQLYFLNPKIDKEILNYFLYQTVLTYVNIPRNDEFIDYRLRKIKGKISENISFHSLISEELQSKVDNITEQILATPFSEIIPEENKKICFLNNPDYELSESELKDYQNKLQGYHISNCTSTRIRETILNWDFETHGIIIKDKLASLLSISSSTVTRNWKPFIDLKEVLNSKYLEAA